MSIALTSQVEYLEMRVTKLELVLFDERARIAALMSRLEALEQTAMRKPGPKPKESNG